MASSAAHQSTGWAVGVIAAAIVSTKVAQYHYLLPIAACVAAYFGGTAPDWLENAWWSRGRGKRLWITHRTWTHWGLAWIVLLIGAYNHLSSHAISSPLFGFAAGGLMHLIADWPNPLGVPWLLKKRYSLGWWKSGRYDYLVIALSWMAAAVVVDKTWFNNTGQLVVKTAFREIVACLPFSHYALVTRWLYPFA